MLGSFPQTSFRGFPALHADVRSASTTSCLPLSSNSPGAQLRMILTIQPPLWFYMNNLFLLILLICWVCPPPSSLIFLGQPSFLPAGCCWLKLAALSTDCSLHLELHLHWMYLPKSAELLSEEHCHPGASSTFSHFPLIERGFVCICVSTRALWVQGSWAGWALLPQKIGVKWHFSGVR